MIVIVEGIDRVGKTTLCEKLAREGFIILKDGIDSFEVFKENIATNSLAKIDTTFRFASQLNAQGKDVVIDRLHLTELVYGSIDRKGSICSPEIWQLELDYKSKDVVLVLVNPTNQAEANERAGQDLTKHAELFRTLYGASELIKIESDFNKLDETVDTLLTWRRARLHTGFEYEYDFYLASPFFRPDQVEREEKIKAILRKLGFKVFSPKEFCFLEGDSESSKRNYVFDSNCQAIERSAAVFAITDTKDIGTIWEAGYAFGRGTKVVYFAETLGNNPFNLMLAQSGVAVYQDSSDLNFVDLVNVVYGDKTNEYGGVIE